MAEGSYVVEVTGDSDKIDAVIDLMRPFGLLEVVRTGIVAMYRGSAVLAPHARDEKPTVSVEPGVEGRVAREGSESDFV